MVSQGKEVERLSPSVNPHFMLFLERWGVCSAWIQSHCFEKCPATFSWWRNGRRHLDHDGFAIIDRKVLDSLQCCGNPVRWWTFTLWKVVFWLRSNSGPGSWTMEPNSCCSWCSMPRAVVVSRRAAGRIERKALKLQIQVLDRIIACKVYLPSLNTFSASCYRTTHQSFPAYSSSTRGRSSWWGKVSSPSFAFFSPKGNPILVKAP